MEFLCNFYSKAAALFVNHMAVETNLKLIVFEKGEEN